MPAQLFDLAPGQALTWLWGQALAISHENPPRHVATVSYKSRGREEGYADAFVLDWSIHMQRLFSQEKTLGDVAQSIDSNTTEIRKSAGSLRTIAEFIKNEHGSDSDDDPSTR